MAGIPLRTELEIHETVKWKWTAGVGYRIGTRGRQKTLFERRLQRSHPRGRSGIGVLHVATNKVHFSTATTTRNDNQDTTGPPSLLELLDMRTTDQYGETGRGA